MKASDNVMLDEYVLTLFASMGVGISNQIILNAMTAYMNIDINSGSESIQNAISQCETAVGSQFITNTFKSNNKATQDYMDLVGQEYLDGTPDYTASASENIIASIDNYKNHGFVSIVEGGKKLILGMPMVKLAEIAGSVGAIGWYKFTTWANGKIAGGLGLLESDLAGSRGQGVGAYKWDSNNPADSPYYYSTNNRPGVLVGHYQDEQGEYMWIVNNSGESINLHNFHHRQDGSGAQYGYLGSGRYDKAYARGVSPKNKGAWGGIYGDPRNYIGSWSAVMYSPDVITPDGNAVPGKNRPTFSHNSDKPYLKPIDIDVYLLWAGDARENTSNGDTGEGQGDEFNLMVIEFFVVQTDPDGVPQGDLNDPNPVYPSQPTYIPTPTYDPIASPTPVTEVIPAPTLTPEELSQELEDKTVRNLGNVFPFCIPFDIVNLFKKMYVPRQAPVITWETNFGQFGSAGTVTIDFSMFDNAASVCRTFELILFILGLMIATKNLIGWGG